jgi:hypothetical protein
MNITQRRKVDALINALARDDEQAGTILQKLVHLQRKMEPGLDEPESALIIAQETDMQPEHVRGLYAACNENAALVYGVLYAIETHMMTVDEALLAIHNPAERAGIHGVIEMIREINPKFAPYYNPDSPYRDYPLRIQPTDRVRNAIDRLAPDHPHSRSIMELLAHHQPDIDPTAMYGRLTPLRNLDALEIYDRRISALHTLAGRNIGRSYGLLLAGETGVISSRDLSRAIDTGEGLDLDAVIRGVHERENHYFEHGSASGLHPTM